MHYVKLGDEQPFKPQLEPWYHSSYEQRPQEAEFECLKQQRQVHAPNHQLINRDWRQTKLRFRTFDAGPLLGQTGDGLYTHHERSD